MRNVIIYLTFIPWILFYSSAVKNSIMYLKNIEFNFYWLKNNIFKAFHFKDLILYGILFYFTSSYYKSSQIWLVSILLFTMINLYLFINSFYDKHRSNEKITSKDLSLIIVISLIISIISNSNDNKKPLTSKTIYVATGGGKEDFIADEEVNNNTTTPAFAA